MEIDFSARIKQLISLHPGLHLRELQRRLGLSFSSTRYHVGRLAKSGEIDRVEDGGYSRLFPAGTSREDRKLFSAVRRGTDSIILSCLLREASLSQKQLCELTLLAKSTISEHLASLIEEGIIRLGSSMEGRAAYQLTDPTKAKMLVDGKHGLLNKAAARFIETWDF